MKNIQAKLFEPYDLILFFLQKGEDLDSCGSTYALLTLIKRKFPDKDVRIVGSGTNSKVFKGFNAFTIEDADKLPDVNILGIFCDIACSRQVGCPRFITRCKHIWIFDHHEQNETDIWDKRTIPRITWEYRDTSYSSCCELVWDLIDKNDFEITTDVAEYICYGIYGDTKGLTTSSVSERTLKILNDIRSKGVDIYKIAHWYHQMAFKYIQLFSDIIKDHSVQKGRLLFMNVPPNPVQKLFPHYFYYNPRTSGITQTKCLTFLLNKAELLIDADVYVFMHYSLYKPLDKNRKLVYVVLTKENPIAESILKQYGFIRNRNRWSYTKGMSMEQVYELIFVKYANEFGVNSN